MSRSISLTRILLPEPPGFVRLSLLTVCLTAAGLMATPKVMAQREPVLEEIIVTAQYRKQSLKSVPVSVAVVPGHFIQEQVITRMADLQFSIPNFTLAESGIGTNVFIRGIGSGNNQGFEQSVGIYVDGIHHGRAQQARVPFLDLERVEVLRGPQSILFGKNSVAGALNITTAKPTAEFEGTAMLSYEPFDDEKTTRLVLSGPLSDRVRVRVAGRYHDLGGYIENLTLNRDEPQQEDWTLRGTAEIDVTEIMTATLKVEHSTFDVIGRNIEIDGELPASAGSFTGLTYSQLLVGAFAQDSSVLDNSLNGKRHANGDSSRNRQTEVVLTLDWALGDYNLRSISGYSDFSFDDECDCDFTGADIFSVQLAEEFKQYSQEIRLTSPLGETFDYIVGAYFQTSDHHYFDTINIASTSVLVPVLNGNPAFAPFAALYGAVGITGAGDLFANTGSPRNATVDSDIYSAFSQISWHISPEVTLQLGGRVTHEKKTGTRNLTITAADGSPLTGAQALLSPDFYGLVFDVVASNAQGAALGTSFGPTVGGTFGALQAAQGRHPVSGSRKETTFSPDIKLTYTVSDQSMLYVSWVRGNKSGGFDFRANNRGREATMAEAFEFEDETAHNYELGGKLVFADGAAAINGAAFFTQFNDLQVSIFDGTLGFNVGNAAKAEVLGFELDGRWQADDNLTLSGALAYTDFQFKDYINGQCAFGQAPNGPSAANGDCDYSGLTNQLVSDWQATAGVDHRYDVGSGLTLHSSVNLFYTSAYHASPQLDPKLIQPAYATVNARIALLGSGGIGTGWSLAILGRNLTDKKVRLFAADAPLSGSTFGTIANYNFLSRGRSLTLQATMDF